MTSQLTQRIRCPNCQHEFKITEEQLGLKNGYTRCDDCETTFLAKDSSIPIDPSILLLDEVTSTPTVTKTEPKTELDDTDNLLFDDNHGIDEHGKLITDEQNKPIDISTTKTNDVEILPPSMTDNPTASDNLIANNNTTDSDDETWLSDLLKENPLQSNITNQTTTSNKDNKNNNADSKNTVILDNTSSTVSKQTLNDDNEHQQQLEQPIVSHPLAQSHVKTTSLGMTLFWSIASVCLLVALYAQYIYFNLNDLKKDPSKTNQITLFCQIIKCQLPVADTSFIDSNVLSIEPSKNNAKQSDIILTLKNTTQQTVVYPNMKITLRQGNNKKAQFILSPAQYNNDKTTVMIAGELKPIKLRIDYPREQFEQANIDIFY